MPENATELTAVEAAAAIREQRLSSEALIRACLARIDARDGDVRAWAHVDPDRALADARARDRAEPSGPLHGVPVGVKDIIDTADGPTEYGSPIYAGHRPDADAACVVRLRAAGAVVLGKTATTEFALFHPAATRNPHDLERTPGGSSSGSAAAVADEMAPVALGTQTAGSVVRPAAFCGVYGLKPTFGLLPVDGIKPVAPSLDTLGAMARSVEDLAMLAGVMAGDGPWELPALPARPRVGVLRTPWWSTADETTRTVVDRAAEALRADDGVAEVADVALPGEAAELVDAQIDLMAVEVVASLELERTKHAELLSENLRTRLEDAAGVPVEAARRAREVTDRCRPGVESALASFDVVLAPAAAGEPPDASSTGDPLFCRPWTLLGLPSVAVPGLRGAAGLPLGVQVLAGRGRDREALAAAAWLGDRLSRLDA